MSAPSLVVPMELDALVVNAAVQAKPFRQWRFNYLALQNFASPEPEAGQGQGTFKPPAAGVYLHWTLPAALRSGAQDPLTGAITYPRVPNRWLVVRTWGDGSRAATGWVVESDCPNSASPSLYLVDSAILAGWLDSGDPQRVSGAGTVKSSARGGPPVAGLGKAFPLDGWGERASDAPFLTAVAPGNAAFSLYQPHCANVFSFYDALQGVAPGALGYLVVGWYSDAAADVLASWPGNTTSDDPFGDRLAELGWEVEGAGGARPTTSLYQGMALGVPWSTGGAPPTPLDAMAGSVHASIGATTADAFTALVARQLAGQGVDTAGAADLLKAFQYGLLPELEEVNGQELLRLKAHQAGFGSRQGGYRWAIVPRQGDGAAAAALADGEAAWLDQLNRDQAALDEAQRGLRGLRWALYATWWKWQKGNAASVIAPPNGFDPAAYQRAVEQELPAAIAAQAGAAAALAARVPQPVDRGAATREEAFQAGIDAFAAARRLADDRVLKPVPGPRFWRATDPVVVLAGVEAPPLPPRGERLACRLHTQRVTGFTAAGRSVDAASAAAALPDLPGASALPAAVPGLFTELMLVDPSGAAGLAKAAGVDAGAVAAAMKAHDPAAYRGTLPALGLQGWTRQPWAPLFMEWEVGYVHVPYQTGGEDNWSFDGREYRYTGPFGPFGADPQAPVRPVGGISLLTPEAQFTFGAQLGSFVDTYVRGSPNPPAELARLEALFDQIQGVNQWRVTSQALTGLGDLLALRDSRAQRAPSDSLAPLVAGETAGVPYIPNGPVYDFHGVRQGQIAFRTLLVYDKFGQVLQVVGGTGVTDPQNFAPTVDPALAPDRPVVTRNPARFAQLPPRVAQHARLDFTLVDAATGGPVGEQDAAGNPVGGWVLPNHLDRSLLLYAPDGSSLGELRLLADAAGKRSGAWQPPPHATVTGSDGRPRALTLADVAARAPLLAAMIADPAIADEAGFDTFLDAVDATLWTIDPLGSRADQNLSVLVGRPLALVRARLRLVLEGDPASDLSGWSVTWPAPRPDWVTQDFAVRLGDQATRADGLIGYFTGTDYSTFNSVHAPEAGVAQSYVRAIGPVGQPTGGNYLPLRFDGQTAAEVTLLVDPRAAVHAITGVLPAKVLEVPAAFVDDALSALEVTFRVGPLLTRVEPSSTAGGRTPANPLSVALPAPAERNGTWSWWEPAAGGWAGYDLLADTPDARLKDIPNELREGFLQLVIGLGGR